MALTYHAEVSLEVTAIFHKSTSMIQNLTFSHIAHNQDGKIIVKAQVLSGGRGKGVFDSGLEGGVKVAKRYTVTS